MFGKKEANSVNPEVKTVVSALKSELADAESEIRVWTSGVKQRESWLREDQDRLTKAQRRAEGIRAAIKLLEDACATLGA